MMATAYIPPGVSIQELTSPSIAPLLALPGSICLVGLAAGVITRTDTITLSGTTADTLPGVPVDATMASGAIVSIIDAINPSLAPAGYDSGTDYTFSASNHTITRQSGGVIPDGSVVYVTYQYTPSDYYQPIRLTSMTDIQRRFGDAWDVTQTSINSPLSHAAMICFENGISNVVLQPLYVINSGARVQPNATQAASASNWSTVFTGLQDLQDINILVPVAGQSMPNINDATQLQILSAAQDFVFLMANSNQQFVVAALGEDSSASSSVAQEATLTTHAQTLASRYGGAVTEQLLFVNTSQFQRANSTSSLFVGGQYMAAAIAGMLASRSPASTITRQPVAGFLNVTDVRTKTQKNTDASNGMLVVESKGNIVQVRHGITMDTSSVIKREINVVRSKHFLIESIRASLETQVIGKLVADETAPTTLNTLVIGVLENLRTQGTISNYGTVESRILSLDPTAMEVRFDYLPAFTVNYVSVLFSLDLSNNSIQVASNITVTSASS